MSAARITLEAALLKAISDDDSEGIRRLLVPDAPVANLLRLRVKPTFSDAGDESAFFHSIASFGLTFRLGDSALDLAQRSGCAEASRLLREVAHAEGVVSQESRITAEAALLAAIAADDDSALGVVLCGSVLPSYLLKIQVKSTFNDASDDSAFFHPIASYGLRFELGDTPEQLSERNGKAKATAALRLHSAPINSKMLSPKSINVVVRNSVAGNVVAEISADTSWTLGMLQDAMERPAVGCWRFILDSSPLTPGVQLTDLCQEDTDTLQLGVILDQVVPGTYRAVSLSPGYGGRRHRGCISLGLQEDGVLTLELHTTEDGPLPCANIPPELIDVKFKFTGAWTSEPPGIVATFGNGQKDENARAWGRRGQGHDIQIEMNGTLKMILVQGGKLEVVESTKKAVRHILPQNFCSVGTVLLLQTVPSDAT
mmetsp:Transcript_96640/g.171868  ORF Transcript_96640/g.171868 Transcript_96640/m.171868 type:complete len:428 (-) Transcript_96640:230-1513(-)|eukprot:CAMPEP_0197634976 /NCGR_PEP_ID=MMETSP1338-20131121/10916_1 /TAXON_ID=43686 ORGANISM="Pelagodinium beii, Strain RCC1491" /NCGR_SAMPLE_ID=MMETSP1338 /ASSEMBLY_ACC=CAM_ASM_000754 /LENGTH=427 /DNA_ID=CAMNT_0043206939 /DNA_START=109 /DNA_END=1392 /DNA_ORIENTATION=-